MTAGRVTFVATSPRIPPGLLSWPAWQALRTGSVSVGDPNHPQLPFLAAAGVQVQLVDRTGGEIGRTSYGGSATAGDLVLAERLHGKARTGTWQVWLSCGEADAGLVRAAGDLSLRSPSVVIEVLHGSYDLPGARLIEVVAVMDRLRSPGGCPWDAEQTHASLTPYLLEEAYEALQAIEDGDRQDLREELGDVLLQVVFHARLAQEHEQPWSIDDVAGDLVDKLVRRHPHVFAGADADDLEGSWEASKVAEKGRTSVTDGVPLGQPALSLAGKLQKRAARLAAPAPTYDGLGGELWELVRRCRAAGLDAEAELRAVARSYRDRLAAAEAAIRAAGGDPALASASDWEARWS